MALAIIAIIFIILLCIATRENELSANMLQLLNMVTAIGSRIFILALCYKALQSENISSVWIVIDLFLITLIICEDFSSVFDKNNVEYFKMMGYANKKKIKDNLKEYEEHLLEYYTNSDDELLYMHYINDNELSNEEIERRIKEYVDKHINDIIKEG